MDYREIAPRAELAPFVKCFWLLSDSSPSVGVERIVPDGCCEIIVNRADPFVGVDQQREQPALMLVGQISRFLRIRPTGVVDLLGVRFRPGGLWPFVDVPQAELTDERPDVGDVCRLLRRALEEGAWGGRGRGSAIGGLEEVLLARLVRRRSHAAAAVALVEASGGRARIGDVAAQAGASARTLERMFSREVGLSPKLLARVVRFQAVIAAVEGTRRLDWAELAQRCGYFDQSHLIRDFRAFSGLSPARYFATEHPMGDYFSGIAATGM